MMSITTEEEISFVGVATLQKVCGALIIQRSCPAPNRTEVSQDSNLPFQYE